MCEKILALKTKIYLHNCNNNNNYANNQEKVVGDFSFSMGFVKAGDLFYLEKGCPLSIKKYKFFLPLFFKRYPLFWLFEDLSYDENRGLGAGDYLCVVPETIHNGHPTDKRQRCRLQSAVKI